MKGRKEHWKTKERMKECHTRKKETRSSGKGKKTVHFLLVVVVVVVM